MLVLWNWSKNSQVDEQSVYLPGWTALPTTMKVISRTRRNNGAWNKRKPFIIISINDAIEIMYLIYLFEGENNFSKTAIKSAKCTYN